MGLRLFAVSPNDQGKPSLAICNSCFFSCLRVVGGFGRTSRTGTLLSVCRRCFHHYVSPIFSLPSLVFPFSFVPGCVGSDRRSLATPPVVSFPLVHYAHGRAQGHGVVSPFRCAVYVGLCYLYEVNIQTSWTFVVRQAVWHLRCPWHLCYFTTNTI